MQYFQILAATATTLSCFVCCVVKCRNYLLFGVIPVIDKIVTQHCKVSLMGAKTSRGDMGILTVSDGCSAFVFKIPNRYNGN